MLCNTQNDLFFVTLCGRYQLCAGADAAFKSKYGITDAANHECDSTCSCCEKIMKRVTFQQVHQEQRAHGAEHGRRDGMAAVVQKSRDFVFR
jgi:hypothetical protein